MQPHARRHINIEYMQMDPETGLKICKLERTLEIFDFLYNQKQLTASQTERDLHIASRLHTHTHVVNLAAMFVDSKTTT